MGRHRFASHLKRSNCVAQRARAVFFQQVDVHGDRIGSVRRGQATNRCSGIPIHKAERIQGMVIAVFRSRLRDENSAEFQALAARMLDIAQAMPGFISYKVYVSEDGERCSIIEFDSPENLRAWREHPNHRAAQQAGRDRYYREYSLHVGEPQRESLFER